MTNPINRNIIRKFAQKFAEASDHGHSPTTFMPRIASEINDPALTEAISLIIDDLYNGNTIANAIRNREGAFPPELSEALEMGDKTGDYSKHLRVFLDYRRAEDASYIREKLDKLGGGLELITQFQSEYATAIIFALSSVEANVMVNQNLLLNLLAKDGVSPEVAEQLKQDSRKQYQEFKETFLTINAKHLEDIKQKADEINS